jgi:hypothetical protein
MSWDHKESLMIWLVIISVIFFIGSIGSLGGIFSSHAYPTAGLDITNSQSLELYGAPGLSVEFSAHAGKSIKGYWAAPDGLTLEIKTAVSTSPVIVGGVPPTPKNWGDSISIKPGESEHPFEITGTFLLTPLVGIGETLEGTLKGELIYPVSAMRGFVDLTDNINIPVNIHVISKGDFREKITQYYLIGFFLAFGLSVILAIFAILLYRSMHKPFIPTQG